MLVRASVRTVSAVEVWTLLKVLQWTQGRFAERGLGTPRLDAEVLLAHVLGYDRTKLYTHFDQPLLAPELAAYKELIKRRLGGEPVAYLTGHKEFRSLDLEVSPAVLIPRPDTETLVEVALVYAAEWLATTGRPLGRIVDVGTGSGAIALALAKAIGEAVVVAIDLLAEAAAQAKKNGERLALAIDVRVGDLLAPVAGEAVDLIVANLPYIPTGDLPGLAPEVQREPKSALDGGAGGLDLVARLIAEAAAQLRRRRAALGNWRRAGERHRGAAGARRFCRRHWSQRFGRDRAGGRWTASADHYFWVLSQVSARGRVSAPSRSAS